MKTTYQSGKWLAICDVCGMRAFNTDLQKDWRGLMVCSKDFESRHPQDLIRVRGDSQTVAWVRPEPVDVFITEYILTNNSERLLTEDFNNLIW